MTSFNLITPTTNTRIVTSAASSTSLPFTWNKSLNATAHKWFITASTGSYTTPWASGLNSIDTSFTYSYSQCDTLVATKGIAKGDSVLLKWTAYAYLGTDSIIASQSNNLWVVREKPVVTLGAFNLLTPSNNARVEVEQNSLVPVTINWNKSANAAKYMWFASTPTGSFTVPLVKLPSNTLGADTVLSLTSGSIDAILASLTIKKGDSAQLKWTVYAYKLNGDSLKASQDFMINLVRKRKLQAFGLTAPVTNTRLEVDQNETTPVLVTWASSATGATYKWFLDNASGNFSAPWAVLNSDNNGADAKLSLTAGAIDSIVALKAVVDGDSVALKWMVRAYEPNDSLQSSQTFNLLVVRKKAVGIQELSLDANLTLYPNPTTGNSRLGFTLTTEEHLQISVTDLQGKEVLHHANKTYSAGNHELELETATLHQGVYVVKIHSSEKSSQLKLIVMH